MTTNHLDRRNYYLLHLLLNQRDDQTLIAPINGRHGETISELSHMEIRDPAKISNCTDCIIENCDISSNEEEHMFVLWNCQRCTVINSRFHGKTSKGCAVKVDGDAKFKEDGNEVDITTTPDGNVFESCTWEDLNGDCEEPLRIGDSRRSHLFYNTTVSNCTFLNLNADEETISIKSCGNIIENCQHINCTSSITIRHGHTNTIQDCTFEGDHGGIRVYGKDNNILRNTFKENKSEKHLPLRLHNGDIDMEENEGSSVSEHEHSNHTQVINNEISENTFDNCGICVRWGEDSGDKKPRDVRFKNNIVIAGNVQSVVVQFDKAQPFRDDQGAELFNKFADNEIVVGTIGTNPVIDSRIIAGFKPPIARQEQAGK